jgi:quinol monooxygenase YgiN
MTVQWLVPLGQSRSMTDALHELMLAARANRGCLGCCLSTDVGTQVDVRYTEEWTDETVLRRELRSDRFARLASLLESSTRPPVVEFVLPDGTRGLDYAEEVRAVQIE